MSDHPRWLPREKVPHDEVWKPAPDRSPADRSAEQDEAAGGRDRRLVKLSDGRAAIASVELKRLPQGRRIYAYLRYTQHGKTVNRYIGEATAPSRAKALAQAWELAHEKGILGG